MEKHYAKMLTGTQTSIDDLAYTPEKSHVSVEGVVKEVNIYQM